MHLSKDSPLPLVHSLRQRQPLTAQFGFLVVSVSNNFGKVGPAIMVYFGTSLGSEVGIRVCVLLCENN